MDVVKVKVVMTTHGTSRFKSCPENRDRRRLAWELRASWKMLGFSKRGSRPRTRVCSWLRARRFNGFSRPAVSPRAQWSQVTGAAALSSASISVSCRLFDVHSRPHRQHHLLDLVNMPIFTALPLSPRRHPKLGRSWRSPRIRTSFRIPASVAKHPKSQMVAARRSQQ